MKRFAVRSPSFSFILSYCLPERCSSPLTGLIWLRFTGVLSCLSNIGPGLSLVGPMGGFWMFSDFSKIVLSAAMLIGRLEIFPVLVLFSPSLWK